MMAAYKRGGNLRYSEKLIPLYSMYCTGLDSINSTGLTNEFEYHPKANNYNFNNQNLA
jgi:hypothetical protein